MKLLFLIPNLTFGGIQSQVLYLSKYFKDELGFDVTICGFLSVDDNYLSILKDHSIGYQHRPDLGSIIWDYESLSQPFRVLAWLKLWWFLVKKGQVVLLPFTKNLDTFFNVLVNFTLVRRTFSFERGGHINPKPIAESFINSLRTRSKPIYVSNSYHGKEAISTIKNIPLEQIHVVRNGIDVDSFPKTDQESTSKTVKIIMVANFFPEKEHVFVLKALAKLEDAIKQRVKVVFAGLGGGTMCEENFRIAKDHMSELHLDNVVSFLGDVANVRELLAESDIGLLATKSEGCPNAILEYMASSMPVLASNIPGVSEIISKPNERFLYIREDYNDFNSKLTELVENEALRNSLGIENRLWVEGEFRVERMGEQYKAIFQKERLLN